MGFSRAGGFRNAENFPGGLRSSPPGKVLPASEPGIDGKFPGNSPAWLCP